MKKQWWHEKVAYQIYPKSFQDTNGDGIGDLKGILEKLDYLKKLGIDIIWISPIYKSPFKDQGYDISDYYDIAPEFGTMEEFDILLEEAKKRDMYIVMDLVINHCSDQHEWFQKALADPEGEYADYFYFRKAKEGHMPANYRSYFAQPAWDKVPGTDQYYLHMFAKEQPDLNWHNPKVMEELYRMINWWLEKGVAGFRIDAIMCIQKDLNFPSYPADGPDGLANVLRLIDESKGAGEMLEKLKKKTFARHDAFTVGEVFNMKEEELPEFIGENGHFSTMFDFSGHSLPYKGHGWYDANPIAFDEWRETTFETQLKCQGVGFLANILENHDEPRGICRFLPKYALNDAGIKMLATVNILLRGIPFLFQGQEIGMRNIRMNSIQEYDDINTYGEYRKALAAGLSEEKALECCYEHSRDNGRTPMQWDASFQAGFTTGTPWLKVNPNYEEINVERQLREENSVLHYYRRLIHFRKNPKYVEVFTYGSFIPAYLDRELVYAYYRVLDDCKLLVAANFSKEPVRLILSEGTKGNRGLGSCFADTGAADRIKRGEILLSNTEYKPGILTRLELKPQQAVVVKCLEQ